MIFKAKVWFEEGNDETMEYMFVIAYDYEDAVRQIDDYFGMKDMYPTNYEILAISYDTIIPVSVDTFDTLEDCYDWSEDNDND